MCLTEHSLSEALLDPRCHSGSHKPVFHLSERLHFREHKPHISYSIAPTTENPDDTREALWCTLAP
jgi:hypothetical protein